MKLTFRSLSEDRIGNAWKAVFDHGWTGWKAWYLRRLGDDPVPVEVCRRMMRRYMPELESSWDGWVAAAGGGEDAARFLSFWSPPRYLVGCSQVALVDHTGPVLIRNYDLDPSLNEATLLKTGWHGHEVIGMVEGMAGLSDGMNRAGLAVSLTFGGRIERRPGFGIPLIMRYVLETCRDVQDAVAAFRSVPSHMSYNITMIDRGGRIATLMLSPDRPTLVRKQPWATNHQLGVEWPRHGRLSRTLERGAYLEALTSRADQTADDVARQFLSPPLHARRYDQGFGTVFTAMYRPAAGAISLTWSDGTPHRWSFDDFPNRSLRVRYAADGSQATTVAAGPDDRDDRARHDAAADRQTRNDPQPWNAPSTPDPHPRNTGDPA